MTTQATAAQTHAPVQPAPATTGAVLQRACACGNHAAGGECESCKKKRESQGGMLQRHPSPSGRGDGGEVPPIVHEVLRSPGQPLDAETRAFMEPRFGHDFSGVRARNTSPSFPARLAVGAPHDRFEQEAEAVADRITYESAPLSASRYDFSHVRIHTDARAAESARQINAQAFTVGNHIVFDEAEYAPQTESGQRLLAHELTHVVQQTSSLTSSSIAQQSGEARLQGRWRLDQVTPRNGVEIAYTRENGSVMNFPLGDDTGTTGGVFGRARAWQEIGLVYGQVGGEAQVAHWMTKHYLFRNDGADGDFLRLSMAGQLAGNAKAEDLRYARAGAAVWGNITERTAANPTPPSRELFEIKDGGISAATVGDLGVIEAEIPIGESGSVRITIPLKKVDEGAFVPFAGSAQPAYDVPSTVGEVDVVLGARIEADADIETALFGLLNENRSLANGTFALSWENRPSPGTGSSRTTAPSPSATAASHPAVYRDGNASGPRIDHVRVPRDIEPDPDGYVNPGTGGVSSFSTPRTGRHWWKFPATGPDPNGINIRNDHDDHYAWEPAYRMTLDSYRARLRSSIPNWEKQF